MKLTTFILIISLMQVTAATFGQSVTLKQSNVSIAKLFYEIRKQTGYDVLIKDTKFKTEQRINANFSNTPLAQVMDQIVAGTNLGYTIENKMVVIKEKEKSLYENIIARFQNVDVKGRILDENGQPLANASIQVKGKAQVYKSNEKGEFNIPNVADDAVLVIRYVGYKQLEIPVQGAFMPLEIKLNLATGELEEVNVTYSTGYQNIPKERVTGSFEHINNGLLNRRTGSTIIERLEGISSGVYFNKNSALSGTSELAEPPFSVRGRSTIFGNVRPLIVVDNFPYDGDINDLNPNDVESISILKDAASASIWGASSGNGVIVITMKKGKSNQPMKVEFNSNITLTERPDIFKSRDFINSSDFIDMEQSLFATGFYDGDITNADQSYQPLSPVVEILRKRKAELISQVEADRQINELRNLDVRDDLSKYFYRVGADQQYSLNLSGGTEKVNYLFSGGYDTSLPNQVGFKRDRITFNFNNSYTPIKNLEITSGINYIQGKSKSDAVLRQLESGGRSHSYSSIYPYATFADEFGNPLSIVKDFSTEFINLAESKGLLNWQFKPISEIGLNQTTSNNYSTRFSTGIRYRILPGLNIDVKYQYFRDISDSQDLANKDSYYTRNLINSFSNVVDHKFVSYNIPLGGILKASNSNSRSHNGRAQLSYDYSHQKHSLSALGGVDIREVVTSSISNGEIYGYDEEFAVALPVKVGAAFSLYPNGDSGIPFGQQISGTIDRFRSWFGIASYTYNSKYVVSASGRIDQSNLFGVRTNQKSVPLWSTGIKWNVDRESFFHADLISTLSFRATYGFNGNLNKTVSAYTTAKYATFSDALGNYYSAATIQYPGNPDLRWEKVRILNLAFDFSLVKNILSGSIEYYNKNGIDIIGDAMVASSSGYTTLRGNFANIKGSGWDIKLNSNILSHSLKWNTSFLFNITKDRITKYTGQTPGVALVEGRPVQSVYSLRWGGLDAQGDPQGYEDGNLSKNYGVLGSLTSDKQVFNGPSNPTFFGSFRNDFSYRNLTISFNLLFSFGHHFRKLALNYNSLYQAWNQNADYSKRWQKPGDELITSVPSSPTINNPNRDSFYARSEALVYKADHIRVQDVSLSYMLDKRRLKTLPFSNIQVFSYINNIGLLWKANKENIDPYYPNTYSPPRSIAFGIRAGL